MGRALDIQLRVIPASVANPFVRKWHYSHKVVNNSQLHFGAFLDGKLHGVISYGPPLDKSKILGLVPGTPWDGVIELNRMAFDPVLPRNSESRCIAISLRLLKKHAPQIKWVVSFADGCLCGDGTIYRASNFILTDIRENRNTARLPDGSEIHKMTLESAPNRPRPELGGRTYFSVTGGKNCFRKYVEAAGGEILQGYQLRYIYFLDPSYREKMVCDEIPYSRISEMGAGMYKGEKR